MTVTLFAMLGFSLMAQTPVDAEVEEVRIYVLPRLLKSRMQITEAHLKKHSETKFILVDHDKKLFALLKAKEDFFGDVSSVPNIDIRMAIELKYANGEVQKLLLSGAGIIFSNGNAYKLKEPRRFLKPFNRYIPSRFGWKY